MLLQTVSLLSLVAIFTDVIRSECQQSFITQCDTFEDFNKYKDVENLNELMIGSDHKNVTPAAVNLMKTLRLGKYNKLTTLYVLRAINKLELTYAFECTYYTSPLKYMTFYGNEFGTIEEYHFPVLALKKFSLVNNKIESIKSGAFTYHEVENFDASNNLMEAIEGGSLPSTNATQVITVKNNRLSHIEPGSFPRALKSLNLDNNNLRYLQKEVLADLNLQELTLSHNKFNEIPTIDHMDKLVIFDISSNAISTVKNGTFKIMDNLQYLDLSNNNIGSMIILEWLHSPAKQPLTISLAYNGLRLLNLTNVSLDKKTLVLYGNPWDCRQSNELKKQLKGHESECDLEFASTGNTPYCFDFILGEYFLNNNWQKDIKKFHDAVKRSTSSTKCDLTPDRNYLLSSVMYGCVA